MSITRDLIVNGEHVPALSGRTAEDINPYTGEVFATVAAAGAQDVTRAVDAAAGAAEEWAAMPPSDRRRIFLRAADLFEERLEEGAEIMAHEDAPLACGLFLADALVEAGPPAGALNVVTNDRADGAEVVSALIADRRVRIVNFTGSTAVGRTIGTLAAQNLKPAVLELGGKNSLVVLDDADLDYAVDAAAFGAYMNAGQICMSVDRVLVDRSIAAEFTERFAQKVQELPTGDPADPSTVIGPAVNARSAERQYALLDDAVAKGATVRSGGHRLENSLVPATVLTDVTPQMDIFAGEIFGAITTVFEVDGPDEAVELANNTDYGLTAGVIAEDLDRGLAVAQRLRTGIVHVNDQSVADEPQAPFGGVQESGYGEFGGQAGIESFSERRRITVQEHGRARFPF